MTTDLEKTLEQLENEVWGDVEDESYLIDTCKRLRKTPISQFTAEDFRIMIGQDISLDILIPLAMDMLSQNILAEGHFYAGDLLVSVITSEEAFWKKNKGIWIAMLALIDKNMAAIEADDPFKILRKHIANFRKIHAA